jgi:hypothetical protein
LLIGLVGWRLSGLEVGLVTVLLGGLLLWLIIGLKGGLGSIQIAEDKRITPNQGIQNSGQNALRIGLICMLGVGLLGGLTYGLINRLATGLSDGLLNVLMAGLIFGLLPVNVTSVAWIPVLAQRGHALFLHSFPRLRSRTYFAS